MVIVLAHPWANRLIWEIQQKNNCTIPGLLSLCWKLTLSAWFGGCLQIDVLLDHFYPARCIRLLVWVPTLNGSKLMFSMEKHRTLIWLVVWNMNFIFPYIGNNHPNWLVFFRGVQTTNQPLSQSRSVVRYGWSMLKLCSPDEHIELEDDSVESVSIFTWDLQHRPSSKVAARDVSNPWGYL